MFIEYDDILRRISDRPIWWQSGLPRFDPFQPRDISVYAWQAALVHTQCQECGARYDVAVLPDHEWPDLRDYLAYTGKLPLGDPPNALHSLPRCAGPTMNSIQIEILEFWEKREVMAGWKRELILERKLAGAAWGETGEFGDTVLNRIHNSQRRREWLEAQKQGDFAVLVSTLEEFGCQRPREVAHAIDIQGRERTLRSEREALYRKRFPSV